MSATRRGFSLRAAAVAVGLVGATGAAASAGTIYILYGASTSNTNLIGAYNDTTNTLTPIGTMSTAPTQPVRNLAQIGNTFYFIDGRGVLYSFGLTTLTTTRIGQTAAFTTSPARLGSDEFGRLVSFDATSTNLYYINAATGATIASYALTGATAADTGDIAITPNGTIYEAFGTSIYEVPATGGALTLLTSNAGITSTFAALAFDPTTGVLVAGNQTGTFYAINQTTGAATLIATANLGVGNNQLADGASAIVYPQLGLTKSHTGTFPIGSTGTFKLQPANTSNYATTGTITVVDTLPAGLTYSSATGTGWTCSASGQVVTCTTTTSVAANSNANPITLVTTVGGSPGSVTNTATASGGGQPAALPTASASDTATTAFLAALSIAKTGTTNVPPGGTIAYSIVVSNGGPSPATNTSVSDPVPSGITIAGTPTCTATGGAVCGTVTVSGQNVTTTIPTFPSGGAVTLAISGSAAATGTYKNTATVAPSATVTDTNGTTTSSVTTSVSTTSALTKTVRDVTANETTGVSSDNGKPGDTLEYALTFKNNTATAVSNFVLTDVTPPNTTFVSASCGTLPAGITACNVTNPGVGATGTVTYSYTGAMASGATGTFLLRVKIN